MDHPVEHLFRLHPHSRLRIVGDELEINYGKGVILGRELSELWKENNFGEWEIEEPRDDERVTLQHAKIFLPKHPEIKVSAYKHICSLRKDMKECFDPDPRKEEDLRIEVKRWIWSLFCDQELQHLLFEIAERDEQDPLQTITSVQQEIPMITLELLTFFSKIKAPIAVKEYQPLAGKLSRRLEPVLESLEPKVQRYFQDKISQVKKQEGQKSWYMRFLEMLNKAHFKKEREEMQRRRRANSLALKELKKA